MPIDATSPTTDLQQCPHCKSPNPAGAARCNCGWVFQGGFLGPSAGARAVDAPVPEDPHRGFLGFARVGVVVLGIIVLRLVSTVAGYKAGVWPFLVLGGLVVLVMRLRDL